MKQYVKSSENIGKWKNFGDVNFLDGGCVVADVSSDYNPGTYHIIRCDFVWDMGDDPAHYQVSDTIIDINDSWIDEYRVSSFADCNKETEPEWFARAVLDYYGAYNCGGEDYMMTAQEVEDYMSQYDIPADIYFDGE
jgi:hypothetical protein